MHDWDLTPATLLPVLVPAAVYATARLRLAARDVRWSPVRDASFALGLLCVATAVVSPLAAYDEQLPVHMVQHLLLGMAAPLAFALAAPVTLILRASPLPCRRLLVRLLHSALIRSLSWTPTGAVLSVGSMWLLYATPAYAATLHHPLFHDLVHAHMLVTGCLLTFALVGPDPVPGRGSRHARTVALVIAFAGHDILGKYLYVHAGWLSSAHPATGSPTSWRLAGQVMWYGGDALDAAIALVFFARWYAASGRTLDRARRRAGSSGRAPVQLS